MDCEGRGIACSLQSIADSLTTSWLETLGTTVVGTALGAGLAGAVAWYVFRNEQQDRYRTTLINAVESLSVAMTNTAKDFERFQSEWELTNAAELPDGTELDIGLEMLIARARGEDRVTARQIREVAYQLRFERDAEWVSYEYATLRRVIIEWASTSVTSQKARANLATIEMRRQMKEANPSVTEEELPDAPARYVRVDVG